MVSFLEQIPPNAMNLADFVLFSQGRANSCYRYDGNDRRFHVFLRGSKFKGPFA